MIHESHSGGRPVQRPAISCYICDRETSYIGSEPHPGTCPQCGSRAVSPAGEIDLDEPEAIIIEGDKVLTEEMFRVQGTDASDREFQFWFIEDDTEPALMRLSIDGASVPVGRAIGTDVLPLRQLRDVLGAASIGTDGDTEASAER